MPKILVDYVLHSFATGGLEKGVATLISYSSPEFQHVVICLSISGATKRFLPPLTQILELNKPPGNSPLFLLKLGILLRSLRPTVIHTRN